LLLKLNNYMGKEETKKEFKFKAYIGERGITKTEIKGDETIVKFEGEVAFTIKTKLFELIKGKEKGVGDVTDNINAAIARQFLGIMGEYGLDCDDIGRVVASVGNLAENLREMKVGEAFKCKSIGGIKISQLLT